MRLARSLFVDSSWVEVTPIEEFSKQPDSSAGPVAKADLRMNKDRDSVKSCLGGDSGGDTGQAKGSRQPIPPKPCLVIQGRNLFYRYDSDTIVSKGANRAVEFFCPSGPSK